MYDPDTWSHALIEEAMLVVSCITDGQEAEESIGRWMREHDGKAFYITTTDLDHEAHELYETGSDFVIHKTRLATMKLNEMLAEGDLMGLKAAGVDTSRD